MVINELNERIEQAQGHIDQLVWIGASEPEYNDQLQDILRDLSKEDQETYFLTLDTYDGWNKFGSEARGVIAEYLYDNDKLGLLAAVHVPECKNFSYGEDGTPTSWAIHGGISRVRHIYAENMEDLVTELEKVSEEVFQEYIKADKEKQVA